MQIVIAGCDPGVANWLDTEGRDEVLATVRWWRPIQGPTVRSRIVGLASLPAGLPAVDPGSRLEEIARRSAHVAWRFRT